MQPENQNISQNQQPTIPITSEIKKEKSIGFRRFHYVFLMFAVLVVPFWFLFGSHILGARAGIGVLSAIFFICPSLFIYQAIILSLALINKKNRETKTVSLVVGVLLSIYYISFIFLTLSLKDSAGNSIDTGEPEIYYNSVFMNIFGTDIGKYLGSFANIIMLIMIICAIAIFVFLLAELVTKKDSKKQPVTPVENN